MRLNDLPGRKISWFRYVTILIGVIVLMSLGNRADAEITGPGWFDEKAPPIDILEHKKKSSRITARSATSTQVATEITPEITALARALGNDPKLIFDYVHNHIEYTPYYGSLKGATATYLDRCGNDFDHASLMIALLRASNYNAQYVYGEMTIPGAELANWLGVNQEFNPVYNVLYLGGIPWSDYSSDATFTFDRVWVQATINGQVFQFDPAFKAYEEINGVFDESFLGYNQEELLASIGGTVGSNYTQGLNDDNLSATMVNYSSNLVNHIQTNFANYPVKKIIGGRKIIQTNLQQYSSTLPYSTVVTEVWDNIPVDKTATLTIQHQGIMQEFYVPMVAGRRLTVTYSGTNLTPELRLDGELIATGSATISGQTYACEIGIDHPYESNNGTLFDQQATWYFTSGSTYAVVTAYAGTDDALIQRRQEYLDDYLEEGQVDTSENVLGETLNIMGQTWLKENLYLKQLLEALLGTVQIRQHMIAVIAQENSYYIDAKASYAGTISKTNDTSAPAVHFKVANLFMSAFEHGMIEQMMGADNPALSTIKILHRANELGNKIFLADLNNYAEIRPQLINYDFPANGYSSILDYFSYLVNIGYTLLIPENGEIGLDSGTWNGYGYAMLSQSGIGMIINGGFHGGYASSVGYVESSTIVANTETVTTNNYSYDTASIQVTGATSTPVSSDPVDMGSGAFLFGHTDLNLGGVSPKGLTFGRSYDSRRNLQDSSLGFGWTHNNDIGISTTSHAEPGLGRRQPVDAAAIIAALYVNRDLIANKDDIHGWSTASLITKWAVDQLLDNSVTVNLGGKRLEYMRLADGSYAPPPGVNTQLIENSDGTFSLEERFGTRLNFNVENRIDKLTDVDDNTMTYSYTGDQLDTVQDAYGRSLSFTYVDGRIDTVVDSTGRSVSYGYDTDGNLETYTDPEGKVWQYGYDSNHQMTTLTNPLGTITATNIYDGFGKVEKQTVPRKVNGIETTADYDFYFSGYRNAEKDPLGNFTIYHFDNKGRHVGTENSLGHRTTITFDGQDHVVEATDPRGNTTIYEYDNNNNLTKVRTPLSGQEYDSEYEYDSYYRLSDIYYSNDVGEKYLLAHKTYYADHHLNTSSVYPDASTEISVSHTYYSSGLPHTTTDGRGVTTNMAYDSNGYPDWSQVADEAIINFQHDDVGRMTELRDRANSPTNFVYDDRGLLETKTDPLLNNVVFTYYDDGKLHTFTDRNSHTRTYSYTQSGKLDQVTYPAGPPLSFMYDAHDNLTQMVDTLGTTNYSAYDEVNRLKTFTDPHGFTVSYDEYDEAGNLKKMTYPGGFSVSYTYDQRNRLETVTINTLGKTATYLYDTSGRLERLDQFNGTWTSYGYDNADRLLSMENGGSVGAISNYYFTLDGNGNRTFSQQEEPFSPTLTPETIDYSYNDEMNRLEDAGTSSFTYDFEGQLIDKDGEVYNFDYDHRLTQIGAGYRYFYDGSGKRLKALRNGETTYYIYDQTGNLLAEADSNKNITRYYIYGKGLMAMATPGGALYCYHFNATGSTIAMSDETQDLVNQYGYLPFGSIFAEQEAVPQPFKFVGQYGVMHEDNGLYYMRARYYDPELGRFLSEDLLGFDGGDINLTVYVANNPVMLVDPNGLLINEIRGFLINQGSTFTYSNTIGPLINNIISDPSGQRIIASGMTSAGSGLVTGALSGAGLGALTTGPLAGAGAVPGAMIGATSGAVTGLTTGLFWGAIKEIAGTEEIINNVVQNIPTSTNMCHYNYNYK